MGGAWLAVGHLVGGGVRRIGSDVSDLPAEERRDGAALFNLALGVFIATFAWWGMTGWFPDAVYGVLNGTFGWMSLLLPLMLFVCAFRLFRQPDDGRGNNRVGIGFLIMTFAGCGLAHVVGGQPTVAEGFDGLRQAGGMLGFLAASPLAALHAAVPVVVYGLLAFISLLIITATPFGAIPRRLRGAYEHLMGLDLQEPGADGDSHDRSYLEETQAAAAPRKKKRRFFGKDDESDAGLEGYVGDEAFEHAVIDDDETDAKPGRGPRPAPGVRRPPRRKSPSKKSKRPRASALQGGLRQRTTPPKPSRWSHPGWSPPAHSTLHPPPLRRCRPSPSRPCPFQLLFRSGPSNSHWRATSPTPCRRRTF
ncbi:DNA translocase FtsK [Arthrobacter sp. Hiyo4]|nr:DNA translocase FtsK [Arthrobacter sp. Hiyo4]